MTRHRPSVRTFRVRRSCALRPDGARCSPPSPFASRTPFPAAGSAGLSPRCRGAPPERIDYGSPWPDAKFIWVRETTELAPGVHAIALVSDLPDTREMRELSLALGTPQGLVVVASCSHPGIENILHAASAIDRRLARLFGGRHLVLAAEPELQRIALRLRDEFKLQRIAPGHCTGEPAFAALQTAFGERYVVCGLGDQLSLGVIRILHPQGAPR